MNTYAMRVYEWMTRLSIAWSSSLLVSKPMILRLQSVVLQGSLCPGTSISLPHFQEFLLSTLPNCFSYQLAAYQSYFIATTFHSCFISHSMVFNIASVASFKESGLQIILMNTNAQNQQYLQPVVEFFIHQTPFTWFEHMPLTLLMNFKISFFLLSLCSDPVHPATVTSLVTRVHRYCSYLRIHYLSHLLEYVHLTHHRAQPTKHCSLLYDLSWRSHRIYTQYGLHSILRD